jgi:hypothetical protein
MICTCKTIAILWLKTEPDEPTSHSYSYSYSRVAVNQDRAGSVYDITACCGLLLMAQTPATHQVELSLIPACLASSAEVILLLFMTCRKLLSAVQL